MERIHRMVEVSIEPTNEEIAVRFVQAGAEAQAEMIGAMEVDTKGWGDAGWSMQCASLAPLLTTRQCAFIETLYQAIQHAQAERLNTSSVAA